MNRGEQRQQMHPPELRRAEMVAPSPGGGARPVFVEVSVGDIRGKPTQEGFGSGRREQ